MSAVRTTQQRAEALMVYCGKYEFDKEVMGFSGFSVHEKGGQLYLDIPQYTAVELKPSGRNEFTARPVYLRLVFNKDAEGKVTGCVAHNTSVTGPASEPQMAKRIS
jgi:hypothetical protein